MGRQEVGAINIARRGMEKLFGGFILRFVNLFSEEV